MARLGNDGYGTAIEHVASVVMDFAADGLGLQYGTVRLVQSLEGWTELADRLAEYITTALGDSVTDVQHIGSTAVAGLLAKPIVDLAIAVRPCTSIDQLIQPMSRLGWIYRGDAGNEGGWVFVMEDAPGHRVAHAHGVESGTSQWDRYLGFRDVLRRSAGARRAYVQAKTRLAKQYFDDPRRYTNGKDAAVRSLLAGNA